MTLQSLGKRRLASGVFLHLERHHLIGEEGAGVARDVVRHPGGVAVLPVDGDRIWLVSQRRAPFGEKMLEIPAGRLETRDGDAVSAAARELREEIGASAAELIPLACMAPSPGYTDEVIHIFAAVGLTFASREPDGYEETHATVVTRRLSEVLRSIHSGEITDGKTQVAVLLWSGRTDR